MKGQEFFCQYIVLCIVSNYEVFINCYRKNYSSCLFTKTASNNCFNSFCAFIWTVLHPRTNKAQVQSYAPSLAQCLWELLVWPAIWPVFINQNTFIFRDIVNIVINGLLKDLFCVRYFPLHLWPYLIVLLYTWAGFQSTQASILGRACCAVIVCVLKARIWNKPFWSFCLSGMETDIYHIFNPQQKFSLHFRSFSFFPIHAFPGNQTDDLWISSTIFHSLIIF